MPTSYPGAIDSLANPATGNNTTNPPHIAQHATANDAIEAIETKLGTGASVPTTAGHVLTVTGAGATAFAAPDAAALNAHLADPTDAHDAAAISFAPAGTIAAADVQTAIAEVATDAAAALAAHAAAETGSSFPAQPAYGNFVPFYRTDRNIEYYYDGTRWLSTTLYSEVFQNREATDQPYSATNADERLGLWATGSSLWLVDVRTAFYVAGGTALSGSHKWVTTAISMPTSTALGTWATVDSGASDVWRSAAVVALGVLIPTTEVAIQLTHTKTGTPGTYRPFVRLNYRLVG
jgi:hypothetical protein